MAIQAIGAGQLGWIAEGATQKLADATAAKADAVWKRYAALFIALSVGAVGCGLWKVVPWSGALFFSLLFLGAGVYALWRAGQEKRAQEREELLKLPLKQVVAVHGWEKLFAEALLPPALFKAKFHEQAQKAPLSDVIATYEAAKAAYDKVAKAQGKEAPSYEIPAPKEYRNKWPQEVEATKGWALLELFERHDLDKLERYGIFATPVQKELTQKFTQELFKFRESLPLDPCKEVLDYFAERHTTLTTALQGCNSDKDANAYMEERLIKTPSVLRNLEARYSEKIRNAPVAAAIFQEIKLCLQGGIECMARHASLRHHPLQLTRERLLAIQGEIFEQQRGLVQELREVFEKEKFQQLLDNAMQTAIDVDLPTYLQSYQDASL